MNGFKISLIMFFAFVAAIVKAQQLPMTLGYVKMSFVNPINSKIGQYKTMPFLGNQQDSSKVKFAPANISSTYYADHLGIMCKQELKLEKAIKFPVKIRLGSKEQVDYLEGKYYQH